MTKNCKCNLPMGSIEYDQDLTYSNWFLSMYLHLLQFVPVTWGGIIVESQWYLGDNKPETTKYHIPAGSACGRGLDLIIVSSLCLIHSESLHGFCHFHLNCNSHWWWLLFHLHSFPACPTVANFFIDKCPIGTICINSTLLRKMWAQLLHDSKWVG